MKVETREIFLYNLITISPFIIFVIIFFLFEYLIQLPRTLEQQHLLELEISKLTPPENAIMLEKGTSHGTSKASVREVYIIDWKGNDIFNYYYKGIKENGWENIGRDEISYYDVTQEYCKQKYTLYLRYYKEGNNWIYSISIYWGGLGECDKSILSNWDYYIELFFFLLTMALTLYLQMKLLYKYKKNNTQSK